MTQPIDKWQEVVEVLGEDVRNKYDNPKGPRKSQTCLKCGIVWEGVMAYGCPKLDCPIQKPNTA